MVSNICPFANPWQQAIDHELVTAYLGIAKDDVTYEEARRIIGELIDWHVSVATDPLCNGGYSLQPVQQPNTNRTTKRRGPRWNQ